MKYYFIFNQVAGKEAKRSAFLEKLKDFINNHHDDIELYITQNVGDATIKAKTIAENHQGEDVCIFACGGDGTMNEVVNGIAEYDNVILGIIPTGSCNDFLKIYPEYDFMDLEKQLQGEAIPMDLIKVNHFYCLNVTNIGFDACVNYDQICYRPRFKTVKKAYNYAIFRNLIKPLGYQVHVEVDDQNFFDGKALLMAFGNGGFYGGGYHCAPKASPNDGIIDVTLIKKISILRFLTLINKYKTGEVYDNPKYKKLALWAKAKKIKITSDKELTISIDGETIHRKEVLIENVMHKIRFMLPKK